MASYSADLQAQCSRAEQRVADRATSRQRNIEVLATPGGMARADEPQRVATRIDRLSRYHADVRPLSPAAVAAEDQGALKTAGVVLERIIGTDDLIGVRYLEAGALAANAVARISVREANGRLSGYGTGSLVSPDLVLTNNHVLPAADVAAASIVEFDHQDGLDGRPLESVRFPLDPERFFLTDEQLDATLVAVRAPGADLARFGFNPLIESEGKAIVGDFLTIVQHPGGEKKQVALRESRLVDVLDLFLHYETDTEPGSSGSPVFNDQWEIIALHHASVPAPEHGELGGIVNEGIRVSRLVKLFRGQELPPAMRPLLDGIFQERIGTVATRAAAVGVPVPVGVPVVAPVVAPVGLAASATTPAAGGTVPLVGISLHLAGDGTTATAAPPAALAATAVATAAEGITVDRDYATRGGYDPSFLGTGHEVPLPTLSPELAAVAAVDTTARAEPRHVLAYHHFSVVLHRERRLAVYTAVNVDGATSVRLRRETDRWVYDPRLPEDQQTGPEVYRDNPLDRGHLVRRLDPAWGPTRAAAKAANDDTFHWTNCTPQHQDFNQNRTTWAGLEDYILDNADNRDFRVSVFTGPVLAESDEQFSGVQLPRQYWKVVAMVAADGRLSATGYLLSQEALIGGLEAAPAEFSYGAYRTYQVPVTTVEGLTGLSFGHLADHDPLARREALVQAVPVDRPADLVLTV